MKVIPLDPHSCASRLAAIDREVKIMRKLRHPHIVQFMAYRRARRSLCIMMEFVRGDSIHALCAKHGRFEEHVIAKYTAQVLQALACAHSLKVMHRDIKGRNILVSHRDEVKLVDFGAAKLWQSGNAKLSPSMDFQYTPLWTAPEVLLNEGYDAKVDVWSVGCVLIEMASAALPWAECEFHNAFAALYHIGQSGHVPAIPTWLSVECRDFIQLCLRRDADKRCSASELLGHAFVKA